MGSTLILILGFFFALTSSFYLKSGLLSDCYLLIKGTSDFVCTSLLMGKLLLSIEAIEPIENWGSKPIGLD